MKRERGINSLKEKVKLLPKLPGVYKFTDKEEKIIYIGKAKSIRNRVSQYFTSPEGLSGKTRVMVSKIADIHHTVVENEGDALLLENNLIKEYQPRYNVMLKDGKTYPWICIKNETFPRVFITRRVVKDGSLYFGPYSSAKHAHNLVALISSLFYLRDCKLSLNKESIEKGKFKPCLKYHINKCKAPCISLFTEEQYNQQIEQIKSLLKGDTSSLVREFRERMNEAASQLQFEEAHKYKEKIELIKNHNNKSIIVNHKISNIDVFTLVFGHHTAHGNYIRIVNGSIIQSLNMEFKIPLEESTESIMSLFISDTHSKFGDTSREILVNHYPDSEPMKSKSFIPQRGDKHYLLELSLKNARLYMKERQKQEETIRPDEYRQRIMESIRKDLSLTEQPRHIECFDNSNIQGTNPVAACVVFRDGVPCKKDYRHFNIKSVTGANDFASMKEVVYRRYSRLLEEKQSLPQLIVIDGGKGQLNFALQALIELNLHMKIKIIGIAKRLEEIIVPGDPNPLFLDKNSPSLKVIMHLRDEAHRFGITHHRNKRSKEQIKSELRLIKGIGEKSEQKLLSRFKSVKGVKEASNADLTLLVGKRGAKAIRDYFGRA